MANTNYTYYGEATVSRMRLSFKVVLDEHERTIIIPVSIVEEISNTTKEDVDMIAILLAYIEVIRKEVVTDTEKFRKIAEKRLIVNVSKLLNEYAIEELIEIIQGLKWHQIVDVLESNNPKKQLDLYV